MNRTRTELHEKITDTLKAKGFYVLSVEEQRGEYIAELEACSPAGEDLIIDVWYNGLNSDFVQKFREYANDFDPDEHAEMWVKYRGTRGVPGGIRGLIDDADAIDAMLQDMADALEQIDCAEADDEYIRENWQEVLESGIEYSDIAHAIGWGFSREDLQELMRLHEADICREKIEDLLTDCNFHTECGDWHDGNYVLRED